MYAIPIDYKSIIVYVEFGFVFIGGKRYLSLVIMLSDKTSYGKVSLSLETVRFIHNCPIALKSALLLKRKFQSD